MQRRSNLRRSLGRLWKAKEDLEDAEKPLGHFQGFVVTEHFAMVAMPDCLEFAERLPRD